MGWYYGDSWGRHIEVITRFNCDSDYIKLNSDNSNNDYIEVQMGYNYDSDWYKNALSSTTNSEDSTNPKDLIGSKKVPFSLIPPVALIGTAYVMQLGAKKYGAYNWRQTKIRTTVYLDAIDRHKLAFANGEDIDPESGESHLSHIIANCCILEDARVNNNLIDDRYKSEETIRVLKVTKS